MIVAERKPFDEIWKMLGAAQKVLVLGCGSCVTVCLSGGEAQAEVLASQLNLAAKREKRPRTAEFGCVTRQCDPEFLEGMPVDPRAFDAVLTMACGVGAGFLSERFPDVPVLPALNTTFYGAHTAEGMWREYCHGCGDCVLAWTGGICPIARCAKSLINGPCGGTQRGKCEVGDDQDCAWHLIFERLRDLGRLDDLRRIRPPRDWRRDRGGGVRRLCREEMTALEEER